MRPSKPNIAIRVEPQLVEKIDAWRAQQRVPPSRTAAIVHMIEHFLDHDSSDRCRLAEAFEQGLARFIRRLSRGIRRKFERSLEARLCWPGLRERGANTASGQLFRRVEISERLPKGAASRYSLHHAMQVRPRLWRLYSDRARSGMQRLCDFFRQAGCSMAKLMATSRARTMPWRRG